MYLSRLEMVGFKSFAMKTDLSFNDGVTAIVGPNGCGKTNIVDAIRWVLGEQKTSALRADSMEQVIFNGSKARKPLGMSEVSLTIENNKKILPTEYSQVVITRRLFRSGESQYLLNKTQCRLRDIVDLFMDTGMGADAYSVIELKMIETILSDKADERRHLFEEAAGVTKYKARRKEATRKLEAAQRDISRVQDIVREVQKTVNSLARQAEKARQHQELSTRLRELDRILFAFEYADEYMALKQLEAMIAEVRQRKEAAEQLLAEQETSVEAAEKAHEQAEMELRTALDVESETRTTLSDFRQQASVLEERLSSVERTIERLDREHSESSQQQVSTEEELRIVRERLHLMRDELVQANATLDERRDIVTGAQAALQSARDLLTERRDEVTTLRQHVNEQRSQADRVRIQGEALTRRLSENERQLAQLLERADQVERQITSESADLPQLETALQEAEANLHNAEARQTALRTEQEGLQSKVEDLKAKAAHTNASLEFLVGLVDTTESSKFLMNTPEWKPSGEKLTLAEVLNTSDDLRVAIEAALGDAARYFVVANRAEAQEAIGALSRNNVGKATFLCRDAVPSLQPPPSIGQHDAIMGWASELVQCDETLRGAVRGILGRTVVVRDVDAAWAAIASTPADSAVTLAGEIVHRSGALRGGSASRTEGVRVGRRERIEQLRQEVIELDGQIATTETRLREIKAELQTIDLRVLGEVVRRTAVARNERQQRIDNLRGRIDDLQGQRQNLLQEAEGFRGELESLTSRMKELDVHAEEAQQQLMQHEGKVERAAEQVFMAEGVMSEASARLREAEILMVRLDGDLQSLQADEVRLSNQSLTIDQRRDQREQERVSLGEQRTTLTQQLAEARSAVDTATAALATAVGRREAQELSLQEKTAASHAASEHVRSQRRTVEVIVQELHDGDLKLNGAQLRMESLVRRAVEELEIEVPTEPSVPEIEQSTEELHTDVQDIRRKLTSMGNVNFLALEEHEREAERLTFLTQQLADLVDSERTLTETIAEINRTAREQFTNTFAKIRENFTELFKVLFSEDDEADLLMVEDEENDPLECKIDIIAKPRGKRPHSIEMLSGGEKTLTAIALLFSIYLVKPSPFCILDEVDAPLDDANIDRYLKIIRKFSENTQFLMITHNKKTMEAADTLYGVTMEEPAVSKVVSVQLSGDRPTKSAA